MALTPCKFTFDDTPAFPGFAHGSKWNGFDNVAVTPRVRDTIAAYFESHGDTETAEDLRSIPCTDDCFDPVTSDPLVSLGWGYVTRIVRMADQTRAALEAERQQESDPHAIARKWVRVLGLGFHPDTRGADYDPPLSPDQVREYDADMETLFDVASDPYECGLTAMRDAGLIEEA